VRIDAHQHYWRFDPVRDSWITPEMRVLQRDFLPADAEPLLAAAGIDGVVAVQASQSEAETDFLLSLAAEHTIIRGVVGWVDLCATDLHARLARWEGNVWLKGFRHIAQSEPDDFFARPEVLSGIRQLGEAGLTYDILIFPAQLAAAEYLVARCPGVRFILDHCAKPAIANGEIAEWRAGLTALARHQQVSCKLSGLVTEAHWHAWSAEQLEPYLDAAAEAFGAHRLMFGSDWPVCLLAADYQAVVAVIARWAERLTASERESLFGGTAQSVYRLDGDLPTGG
jgi:L-fuconolactonase